MNDETELLRRYANERAQDAFAELVRRHVDLVYAVALRQVGGDAHLAKDVVQTVFATLARKAAALSERAVLAGWLYRATQYAAIDVVRAERRRRTREREAAMNEITETTGEATNWDAVRPLLDESIAELGDVDRDAVVLRFIGGRSFAEVGARLRLSENAARMRVERALEKLHASLRKRGVRSTAAAVAVALGSQANVAAPAGLAAAVTSGAIGASATVAGAGILAGWATAKTAAVVAGAAAVAGIGVVATQRGELREAERALSVAREERAVLERRVAETNARLAQVEQRAEEAERDSGELLKAVEAEKARRVAATARNAVQTQQRDEGVDRQRAYQQELARVRAEEAKAQAAVLHEAEQMDAVPRYERLIQAAREQLAAAQFRQGIRFFNEAMQAKPRDVVVTPEVKQLQAELAAQNTPVDLALVSDGETFVSIMGARSPAKLVTTAVKILPGNYEIVGRRSGYRDVVIPVQVRNGTPLPPITVICATRE